MKVKKILREPLFYLLFLLAVAYLIVISEGPKISDVKLINDNKIEHIELPYSNDNVGHDREFNISFDLLIDNNKSAKFNIVPDDCIREILINGNNFPLDSVNGLCDQLHGAYYDFSKYVSKGLNHFEFRLFNHVGHGGLQMNAPLQGFKTLPIASYIFAILFLLCAALILGKFNFKLIAISIILLGIAVRLVLYTYTGPRDYSNDEYGHLRYIQIVAEEKRLPDKKECWECYQPPLYYIASAVVKSIADSYDPSLTNRILQQWSLLFSFATIALGVALILNLFGNNRGAYFASLVIVLWPGFVLSAPRIGNDILFYLGALFCMLFTQRYWRLHKNMDILLASLGASIALAAKSTGFVILGVWFIIYAFSTIYSMKIGSLRVLLGSVFIIVLFIVLSNHRTIVGIFEGKKPSLVDNIGGLPSSLKVQNTLGNYLYFDLKDYLLEPYVNAFEDKGGRQYFWNYAINTSLFGEFRVWDTPTGRILATMLNALALFIFVLALWGIIHLKIKELPSLLFVVFLFTALISYRIMYPYSCNNNFRFIFPVLFPLVYFSIRGTQIIQDFRLRMLSYTAMLFFAALSFLFIVGQAVSPP
jgi:hypothetical protein